MSGIKFDSGKPAMHLIAPEFVFALATVLGFGAEKYGDRNWEEGMEWSRLFAAVQRHLWAWWSGETLDPESNLNHLAHAAFGLMVLVAYSARASGTDDRPAFAARLAADFEAMVKEELAAAARQYHPRASR